MENKMPKIFVIAGKARSGKDTVASIIKDKITDKKVINLQYSFYIKEYAKKISSWDGSEETKPRELLQIIGTDIIRNKIDKHFFIKKLIDDIKVYSYFFDVITISDARYKDEIELIKESYSNTISIGVMRPNFDNGLTSDEKKHPTEIDLDDYDNYDYKIINDGNLLELEQKVEKILEEVNL